MPSLVVKLRWFVKYHPDKKVGHMGGQNSFHEVELLLKNVISVKVHRSRELCESPHSSGAVRKSRRPSRTDCP